MLDLVDTRKHIVCCFTHALIPRYNVLLLLCLPAEMKLLQHMDALTRSSAMGNHGQGPARKERRGTLRNPAKERVIFWGKWGFRMPTFNDTYAQMTAIVWFCDVLCAFWITQQLWINDLSQWKVAVEVLLQDVAEHYLSVLQIWGDMYSYIHEWYESYELKQWSLFKLSVCRLKRNLAAMNPPFLLENLTCPQFVSHPHVFPRWLASKLQPNGTSEMKYHGSWTSPDFAYFNLRLTLVFMLPFGKLRITIITTFAYIQ